MKTLRSTGLLLIVFLFVTAAVPAQRRRPTPPRTSKPAPPVQPAPTFENVLAAESYRVYGEIRGVGQLVRSPALIDVIDPMMKVAAPPKEFKTLMKWLNSEADELMTSRMMFAASPSRANLPAVLFAIEFASAEEAQKFEPRLKAFLPKFLPTPTPESSPATVEAGDTERKPVRNAEQDAKPDAKPKETLPQYVVKQSGALVFISDKAFTFKNLRPTGSKLLTEDPNFRRVHDRFATESVLVYVDTGAMEREQEERYKQIYEEEQKRAEAEAANPSRTDVDESESEMSREARIQSPPPPVAPVTDPDVVPEVQTETGRTVVRIADDSSVSPAPGQDVAGQAFGSIASLLFGGRTIWPEAVGVAVAFEPDSYSLRLLLMNEPGVRGNAIPFIPQLVSGPQLTPESPSVFPADTEFFVALSLDYVQIYEGMLKALTTETTPAGMRAPVRAPPESPFAAYEKTFGIKIKDDLIPLLGNEIALSLPVKTLDVGPSQPVAEPTPEQPGEPDSTKKTSPPQGPNPVIAISVKDRDGVRALIPRLIESFGLKGASLLAQTEKRGDTEIVSYADAFSYAFIGNFLLVSPDPKALSHVVDSYLNHETLAGESHFRNYTRWQPRQVLGQLYVSPALMESYTAFARNMDSSITDQLGDLLSRLSPTSEPVTYALSNEGLGPLHEIRVPKNLTLVMIAAIFGASSLPATPASNESVAKGLLRTIVSAEATYQATTGDGNYGTIEQLVENGLILKDMFEKNGYRIELTAMGSRFEATAVPLEYGKTGKLSFFVDESAVIRGGDKGGGAATVADNPVQ